MSGIKNRPDCIEFCNGDGFVQHDGNELMKVIHKYERFHIIVNITVCKRMLNPKLKNHTDDWKKVTCKQCLKNNFKNLKDVKTVFTDESTHKCTGKFVQMSGRGKRPDGKGVV